MMTSFPSLHIGVLQCITIKIRLDIRTKVPTLKMKEVASIPPKCKLHGGRDQKMYLYSEFHYLS